MDRGGVVTGRVDDLLQAMGRRVSGLKQVAGFQVCKEIRRSRECVLLRPIAGEGPILVVDAPT